MVDKIIGLRVFPDHDGAMNCNLREHHGAMLVVSQFTLYADLSRGNRPGFRDAARQESAVLLYNQFVILLAAQGLPVQNGEFGATMDVDLVNDGPFTIWIEREADPQPI